MKKTIVLLFCIASFHLLHAQFGLPNLISKGVEPNDVTIADIDQDGDDDLIIASGTGDVLWHENLGKGKFASLKVLKASDYSESHWLGIWVLDLNGDKNTDIITYTNKGVFFFENKGLGILSFEEPRSLIPISFSGLLRTVRITDLDSDGDLDLVVGYNSSHGLRWHENDGSGAFGDFIQISSDKIWRNYVFLADMDGDGDNDIVTCNWPQLWGVVLYENLGGSFVLNDKKILIADTIAPLRISDYDNDGDPDIMGVSGELGSYTTRWLENTSTGLVVHDLYVSRDALYDWQPVDLDKDGDMDQVLKLADTILVVENKGGNYSVVNKFDKRFAYINMFDVDGDNDIDLLSTTEFETSWFENTGNASLGTETTIEPYQGAPEAMCKVDLNNDKDMDLVLSYEYHLVWKENKGNGRFGPDQLISDDFGPHGTDERSVQAADFNGDGEMDILITNDGLRLVAWYENLGKGKFGPRQTLSDIDYAIDNLYAHPMDVDGDGDVDIVWGDLGNHPNWNENLGGGKFSDPKILLGRDNDRYWKLHLADMDNDGKMDLVTTIRGSSAKLGFGFRWHKNEGNGVFSKQDYRHDGHGAKMTEKVMVIDTDGDGDVDVLELSTRRSTVFFHENLGGGSFIKPTQFSVNGSYDMDFTIDDLDNDGDLDMMEQGYAPNWWENLGDNTFKPRHLEPLLDMARYGGGAFVFTTMDADKDGDLDIIWALPKKRELVWTENFWGSRKYLKGRLFYDANENGNYDNGEIGLKFMRTEVQPGSLSGFTNSKGLYTHEVHNGVHTITPKGNSQWKITGDSTSYTRAHGTKRRSIENLDFGFVPTSSKSNFRAKLVAARPRCNRRIPMWCQVQNKGTTILSGLVHLKLDDSLQFDSAPVTPDSIIGQNIYWHFDDLFFFDVASFAVYVKVPPANHVDNYMESFLTISELDDHGNAVETRKTSRDQKVICAFDPNDKQVSPKGDGILGLVEPTEKLSYLVRFQNTGNDTAFTVMIRDQLDTNLDWSTLEPTASSHPMEVMIAEDGKAVFTFKNILLPDSNVNELESHGFVEYTILPKKDIRPLAQITGPAQIYFDYNMPIVTNDILTTITCYTAPQPIISFDFPNLNAGVADDYTFVWYLNDEVIENETSATLIPLKEGSYAVEVIDTNTCSKRSESYDYKADGVAESLQIEAAIYPNPFSETTTIIFDRNLQGDHTLVIYDLVGAEITRFNNISGRQLIINKQEIGSGMFLPYLINIQTGEGTLIDKLMVR